MTTTGAPFNIYSPGVTNGPPNSTELAAMAASVASAMGSEFTRIKRVANVAARTTHYNSFGTPSATNPCIVWRADATGGAYLEATITNNSGWFAVGDTGWATYTPTLTNMTKGNGTVTAAHRKSGGRRHVRFSFTLGSTSAVGSIPSISLPTSAVGPAGGVGYITDAGVDGYPAQYLAFNSTAYFYSASGLYLTPTYPFTWSVGDSLQFTISYFED